MSRTKKALVMALLLVVVGMIAAETYEQAIERHGKEIFQLWSSYSLWWWICFWVLVIYFVVFIVHDSKLSRHESQLKQISILTAQHTEITARLEALMQHNRDLIDRHEEMMKVLMLKSGNAGPSQSVVIQQPKALPKPANPIVEFNPNSQDDQTWLAKQKRQRPQ